jgi:hypothetical protein
MKCIKKRKSKWEWYGVKLLYECIISGNSNPEYIDKNYTNSSKTYEESVVLVKAQSFEHAYKIAEKIASESEHDYTNTYEEKVEWIFVKVIDIFQLFDDELKTGTEVYSRFIRVQKGIPKDDIISAYYPETTRDEGGADHNFIFRIKEFKTRQNSSN